MPARLGPAMGTIAVLLGRRVPKIAYVGENAGCVWVLAGRGGVGQPRAASLVVIPTY